MRHSMPEDMVIALRAPRAALVSDQGPLRASEAQAAELAWTLDAAERLRAQVLVLPTPADLMPSPRSRDLLARFAEGLPQIPGRRYIWAPRGAWEPEHSAEVAHQLGLVCAFDPLQQPRPPGTVVYANLATLGVQTNFSEAMLLDVFERIAAEPFEDAYVSIDSMRSFQQALRMHQVVHGDLQT